MDAVARNSSEDVLRTVDRLLVEGQSAQHFARQLVRFLRNALVAKVAGSDSHGAADFQPMSAPGWREWPNASAKKT